jgi:hypothetical protein
MGTSNKLVHAEHLSKVIDNVATGTDEDSVVTDVEDYLVPMANMPAAGTS